MSYFSKCFCGNHANYIGKTDILCRIHYDQEIKEGKTIPSSHYVTEDGYKVIRKLTNSSHSGLYDIEYHLVKVE